MKARKLFASLLTAAMLTCTTSAAFACVHGMEMDVNDEETESIYTAEDAFYDGDYRKTVGHLLKIKPDMRKRTSKYTKAAGEDKRAYLMLAAAIGAPIGAAFIFFGTIDPYLAIPARFWLGSALGGVIFGVGMVFAGGCASGSLWRMGEGLSAGKPSVE